MMKISERGGNPGGGKGLGTGGGRGRNKGGAFGTIKCPACGHTMVREELLNQKGKNQ